MTNRYWFIEGVASPTAMTFLPFYKEAKITPFALDILDDEQLSSIWDENYKIVSKFSELGSWQKEINLLLNKHRPQAIIPCIDEGFSYWSKHFAKEKLILSEPEVIELCNDKWKLYQFLSANKIATIKTSLSPIYPYRKPRYGRGSAGHRISTKEREAFPESSEEYISQELMEGKEISADLLFDKTNKLACLVQRERNQVEGGKSVVSTVVNHKEIADICFKVAELLKFYGPVNIQFKADSNGKFFLMEINPRIASGMSLSMKASFNWFLFLKNELEENDSENLKLINQKLKYGLKMRRYYSDFFYPESG